MYAVNFSNVYPYTLRYLLRVMKHLISRKLENTDMLRKSRINLNCGYLISTSWPTTKCGKIAVFYQRR